MAREKICGIYCIENVINHKKYIGSSIDIYNRWQHHKQDLNRNSHHSIHLNNAWLKYGEKNFKFYILEKCESGKLIETEQYYIDLYKVADRNYGYNIMPIAGRVEYNGANFDDLKNGKFLLSYKQYKDINYLLCNTDTSVMEVSKIVNISYDTLYKIYSGKQYKKIFDSNKFIKRKVPTGERNHKTKITDETAKQIISMLLESYTSLEISQELNVPSRTIIDIRNHNSWNFLTEGINFPHPRVKVFSRRKAINQYNINGKYLKTFDCADSAVNYLNNLNIKLSRSRIQQSCSDVNNYYSSGGFFWKYYDEHSDCSDLVISSDFKVTSYKKRISKYSLNNEYICDYDSLSDASRDICGDTKAVSTISSCLSGTYKTAHGYIWKYA